MSVCLSVCTTIFKRIVGLCAFILNVWRYSPMDSSQQALQNFFQIHFELLTENRKILKRLARLEYLSKCNVLYVIAFVLTSSLMKVFFQIRFRIIGRKRRRGGICVHYLNCSYVCFSIFIPFFCLTFFSHVFLHRYTSFVSVLQIRVSWYVFQFSCLNLANVCLISIPILCPNFGIMYFIYNDQLSLVNNLL